MLLLNFFVLGTSRLRAAISGSAAQGVVLGVLALRGARAISASKPLLIASGAIVLKGVVIPALLTRAMREVAIRREIEPLVGYVAVAAARRGRHRRCRWSSRAPCRSAPQHVGSLLVPASLATVLTGFLLLTTRRKAITQVVGYLVLENGIFIFGLPLLEAMPFLVEIGVLLDLFVGIFVMGIIINHINREFSSLDTARLSALKE